MNFASHKSHFSATRMLKYERATTSEDKAIDLYKHNILLSQSIYPLICILEVALRNAIDRVLREKLGGNWIIEGIEGSGFMNDPKMVYFDEKEGMKKQDTFLFDKVLKIKSRLHFEGTPFVHNKIVGEIGLGFWVKLLDSKPISILGASQLLAIPNYAGKNQIMHTIMSDIVRLRNRISHHEPICFNKEGNVCIDTMNLNYRQVKDAIGWIDSDLMKWSDSFDNVKDIIRSIDKNILNAPKITATRFSPAFLSKGK